MSPLRIQEIEFKAGPKCKVPRILLLVGPNGSGKSLALNEINTLLYKGHHDSRSPEIVSQVTIQLPQGQNEALKLLSPTYRQNPSEPEIYRVLACNDSGTIKDAAIHPRLFDEENLPELLRQGHIREALMDAFSVFPRLQTTFSCLENKKMQVMKDDIRPDNIHQLFLKYPFKREKVNSLLQKTFKRSICVELQNNGELRFVISRRDILPDSVSINPSPEEQQFFRECRPYSKFGDGFKAFVGLVTLIFSCDHRILLLDEPELYLHAPLIRSLAHELVNEFQERDGTIIAATHSADFVAGCLEATEDVSIVRLTYSDQENTGTANTVEHEMMRRFVRNPVLRNLDALPGIFYEVVVVVEGQNDKIAYSEINRKLNQQEKGITDVHFIGATGKTYVYSISEPFAKSGIPTALVYDFDFLLEKGVPKHVERFASMCCEPAQLAEISNGIAECLDLLKDKDRSELKSKGLRALDDADGLRVKDLITRLAAVGVFIVPVGELESWFSMLGFDDTGGKGSKLETAMNSISDTNVPADLDDPARSIWAFIHQISLWVKRFRTESGALVSSLQTCQQMYDA